MSAARKKQQTLVLALAGTAIVAASAVGIYVLAPKATQTALSSNSNTVDMSILADRTSSAAPEMSWVATSRQQLKDLRELVESQNKTLTALREQMETDVRKVRAEYDEILVQQAERIEQLTRASSTPAARNATSQTGEGQAEAGAIPATYVPNYSRIGSEFVSRRETRPSQQEDATRRAATDASQNNSEQRAPTSFGVSFVLNGKKEKADEGLQRIALRNYVPAGSYAPAVVLSGADAATNVSDRENPTPVLMRITGPAVTAAQGSRKGKVQLRGCTVQGSAIGDLSSERVKVRLISMTCLDGRGRVIETAIKGYIAGRGKAGVRGRVVAREGKLLGNAALAGVLEGVAGAVSGSGASASTDVTQVTGNALSSVGASGLGQAASSLSEYYINRAEQYQPVVSLYAGTEVDVVFLEGVSLK